MDQTSPWVPLEDGTMQPSAELAKAYRTNPENFPHFLDDAVALSGKTREEVQAIIDNPYADGNAFGLDKTVVGPVVQTVMFPDVRRGIATAAGTVAEKLGFTDAGQAIKDYGKNIDPEFDTERGFGDNLAEVAGQAAPAVGGAIATGGVVPAAIVGAGLSSLTFEDEDNLANVVNSLADGAVPDVLVVNPEDEKETALAKSFTVNLLTDLATAGAANAVGKLYKLVKSVPNGFVDMKVLRELSDEAGVPLRDGPVGPKVTPEIAQAKKSPTDVLDKSIAKGSSESIAAKVADPQAPRRNPANPQGTEEFVTKVNKVVDAFDKRTAKITDFGTIRAEFRTELDDFARQVYGMADTGRISDVTAALKTAQAWKTQALAINEIEAATVHRGKVTRAVLEKIDGDFGAIITQLRAAPDDVTRANVDAVARAHIEDLPELWDFYRNIGTSPSFQLLLRRGGGEIDDVVDDFAKELTTAMDTVGKDLKDSAIALKDNRMEFVTKKLIAFDDPKVSPANFIADLYAQFDEFEKMVAGKKANQLQRVKLTPVEKLGLVGKAVQTIKDFQTVALLGQFMTSLTEVVSTGFHTLIIPSLRVAGGGSVRRWGKEMAGLAHATALSRRNFARSFIAGKDVTDDFLKDEGALSRILDHETMSTPASLVWRTMSIAVDLAQASSAFFKTMRAYGLAYADGLEVAFKNGMPKGQAKKYARDFASKRFDEAGAIIDEDFRIKAGESAFQMSFDGTTLTGKLGQKVEDFRNSTMAGGLVGLAARSALPFFRTLMNIGHDAAQMIMPLGSATALKRVVPGGTGIAKFLDDFTGKNGQAALQMARGRQRVGAALTVGAFGLTQLPGVEITGPSRTKRWDAKKRAFEVMPASSLIIGNQAFDLSRALPFSAPLMLAGVLRDYQIEDALRMEGGEYVSDDSTVRYLTQYLTGTMVTMGTLLQDAGASRGVFDFMDAAAAAINEQDMSKLTRYVQQYATQFIPGTVKMVGKATGDTQHEGYNFWDRFVAGAGFDTDWEKLDFLGQPIQFPLFRGIDPSNRKLLKLDDPAYAEFAFLNKVEDLALALPDPDKVFSSTEWTAMGLKTRGIFGSETPSLDTMKTGQGDNAWKVYRSMVYKGKPNKDIEKTVENAGVKVVAKAGETFEQASRRLIALPGYKQATPKFRAAYWQTLHGIYKEQAKGFLKGNFEVNPSLFEGSKYGSPISSPASFGDTKDAAKALSANVNRTRGNPLDDIFAIK
jgi:hypothetical protein